MSNQNEIPPKGYLPEIGRLQHLPPAGISAVIDMLFEPTQDLADAVVPVLRALPPDQPLQSYAAFVDLVRRELLALRAAAAAAGDGSGDEPAARQARTTLLNILGAHPRLGAKKVDSAQSAAEQAQLQTAAADEAAKLAALNAEYEAAFPGLIYVVFVNGRSRDVIMANMRERIARADYAAEELEAIEAMAAIANDRASKLPIWKGPEEAEKH